MQDWVKGRKIPGEKLRDPGDAEVGHDGRVLSPAFRSVDQDTQDIPQSQYPLRDGIPPFEFPKTRHDAGTIDGRHLNQRQMRIFSPSLRSPLTLL